MRIASIDRHRACCEAKGVRRDVSLSLLGDQDVAVGDYVLVHVGYALQIVSADEAGATWDLLEEVNRELDRAGV